MSEFNFNAPVTTQVVGDGATIINQGQTDDLQTLVKRLETLIEQTEELQEETRMAALNHLDVLAKSDSNPSLDSMQSALNYFKYLLEAGITSELTTEFKLMILKLGECISQLG